MTSDKPLTEKPSLTIRIAQPEDAAEIARLNALFNGVQEPAERYAQRLSDTHCVDTPLLAEIGGRAIGLANLRLVPTVFYPEPYAELTELYVEEGYRRQGAGRALIACAEALALNGGAHEMVILTNFYNHPAKALYLSLGYQHRDLAVSKQLK